MSPTGNEPLEDLPRLGQGQDAVTTVIQARENSNVKQGNVEHQHHSRNITNNYNFNVIDSEGASIHVRPGPEQPNNVQPGRIQGQERAEELQPLCEVSDNSLRSDGRNEGSEAEGTVTIETNEPPSVAEKASHSSKNRKRMLYMVGGIIVVALVLVGIIAGVAAIYLTRVDPPPPPLTHNLVIGQPTDLPAELTSRIHLKIYPMEKHNWAQLSTRHPSLVYALSFKGPLNIRDVISVLKLFNHAQNITFFLDSKFCDEFSSSLLTAAEEIKRKKQAVYTHPNRTELPNIQSIKIVVLGRAYCDGLFDFPVQFLSINGLAHVHFENVAVSPQNRVVVNELFTHYNLSLRTITINNGSLGYQCPLFHLLRAPKLASVELSFRKNELKNPTWIQATFANIKAAFPSSPTGCSPVLEREESLYLNCVL